jgi:hypothetical protein
VASSSQADAAIRELRDEMNRLRGRLFQAVEAAGLPDRQEQALKGLVRQASYDVQSSVEAALRREHATNGTRVGA